MPILPPPISTPAPQETPDWPLVPALPEELVGKRITPALSVWLKGRRKEKQEIGRVVELARPGVPPLRVDLRKWPQVTIERVRDLNALTDESVSFLWTPFALQPVEERETLVDEVQQVMEPGGTWAFVDVMPTAMPGHWLYRFFPQAWENEERRTWDASRMYNVLLKAGFRVRLERRTFYQTVALGVARSMAGERRRCPQLAILPDEVYGQGLAALEEAVQREGKDEVIGSEFCLVEVTATRG
jgi:hypothetical protein